MSASVSAKNTSSTNKSATVNAKVPARVACVKNNNDYLTNERNIYCSNTNISTKKNIPLNAIYKNIFVSIAAIIFVYLFSILNLNLFSPAATSNVDAALERDVTWYEVAIKVGQYNDIVLILIISRRCTVWKEMSVLLTQMNLIRGA